MIDTLIRVSGERCTYRDRVLRRRLLLQFYRLGVQRSIGPYKLNFVNFVLSECFSGRQSRESVLHDYQENAMITKGEIEDLEIRCIRSA